LRQHRRWNQAENGDEASATTERCQHHCVPPCVMPNDRVKGGARRRTATAARPRGLSEARRPRSNASIVINCREAPFIVVFAAPAGTMTSADGDDARYRLRSCGSARDGVRVPRPHRSRRVSRARALDASASAVEPSADRVGRSAAGWWLVVSGSWFVIDRRQRELLAIAYWLPATTYHLPATRCATK
jgi:hypothetical protein